VIILGLIFLLLAIGAGILLFQGTMQLTEQVDIDIDPLGVTVGLSPLALLITGAAVITVFWLGWVLLRQGVKRGARRRRETKEEAALAEQRRVDGERKMQEEFAQRERQLAEERRQHEQETEDLRRQTEEQHLSTEEARRRAEIAEAEAARNQAPGTGAQRDSGDNRTLDPRDNPRT
jgi:uncharacterized membrane protein